ncbi:hypothetical protein [Pseudomonas sp. Irchel 3A7]|uniref:hypothetical protein n=1 Tax=Pseudomonas sp. Irchel 3A7 TaxID=2008913 RepID=UPI001140891D|nr:hypothetical protein [Pseudomonas sp. Irchel 3A7]
MDQLAKHLSAVLSCTNNCTCEHVSISRFSPSPVQNEENIAACASHPHHSDKAGNVTHKVFDRAFTQGLSVTRLAVAEGGMAQVISTCVAIDAKKKGKTFMGVVTLTVDDVRNIIFKGCNSRAFNVYDTAYQSNPAHADVVGSKYFGNTDELPKLEQLARNRVQKELLGKIHP